MADTDNRTNLAANQAQRRTEVSNTDQANISCDIKNVANGTELPPMVQAEELHSVDSHYALLLIDAHTHMFSDFLMHRGTQLIGRKDTKEHLCDAVKRHIDKLDSSMSAGCRTVVRGYYDMDALDEEMRDRFPRIAATFSAMDTHFDFTYVLGEAAVEQKIVDLYVRATRDENCKHILLAAWGRPSYLRILQVPNNKAAIVEGPTMGLGLQILPLALPIIEMPHIFRIGNKVDRCRPPMSSELYQQYPYYRLFYAWEACAAGNCGHTHATVQSQAQTTAKASDIYRVRRKGPLGNPTTAIPGHVPINRHGQRVDVYFPHPKAALRRAFDDRFPPGTTQPCNWYHLSNNCRDAEACLYDHSVMTDDALLYLRFRVSMVPCTDGSQCRRADCFFGHICRMQKCVKENVLTCMMRAFHHIEPTVAQWVKGTVTYHKVV